MNGIDDAGSGDGEAPELYSAAWWDRFARNLLRRRPEFGSVEKVLDSFDPGWRARRELARAREDGQAEAIDPARPIGRGLGRVADRAYRQVNVKLGEGDFEALQSLAAVRDLPPATLARILLRAAIGEAAQRSG